MIGQRFNHLPNVVKNLLIINGLFFLAKATLISKGINLDRWFALHQFQSQDFMPHQLVTHMFMHGNLSHLLFNMLSLWIFGKTLENVWGQKRFLTYYIITGLGAALVYTSYMQFQIADLAQSNPEYMDLAKQGMFNIYDENSKKLSSLVNTPMLGASGAVYGLLLAFGILFPNSVLMLLFPPIPIKAKYLVIGLALIALFSGISNVPGDNIAHFAHLGGMIIGIILLKYWKNKGDIYY